jgi:hypothetical protein
MAHKMETLRFRTQEANILTYQGLQIRIRAKAPDVPRLRAAQSPRSQSARGQQQLQNQHTIHFFHVFLYFQTFLRFNIVSYAFPTHPYTHPETLGKELIVKRKKNPSLPLSTSAVVLSPPLGFSPRNLN